MSKQLIRILSVAALVCVSMQSARLSADSTDGRFGPATDALGGIKDSVTGLTWQQSDGNTYDWATVQSHCVAPWRLPTISELYTLVDIRGQGLAIDSIFTGSGDYYWSSMSYGGGTSNAWIVDFQDGSITAGGVSNMFSARCVR